MISEKEAKRKEARECKKETAKRQPVTTYMHVAPVTNNECESQPRSWHAEAQLKKNPKEATQKKTRYQLHAHGAGNEDEEIVANVVPCRGSTKKHLLKS